jgi:multiple sugar transport system ATP-binding protein
MASLTITGVTKSFGAMAVLKGIDLEVADGEFIVLVGPSGCGKSTLLAMVAGLESVSTGEIAIAGRIVNRVPPMDRNIAMVFQSYALYPTMTARENMTFGMECRGVPKAEQKAAIDRVAALLQIGHLLDRKPSQLSGGQRQRVAMAAPSSAIPSCSCSTSPCRTSTPSCASRCAPRSSSSTSGSGPPPSMSPTTRSRR